MVYHSYSAKENEKDICEEISAAVRTGNCILLVGLGFSLLLQTVPQANELPQKHLRELLLRMFQWCLDKKLIPQHEGDHEFRELLKQKSLDMATRKIEEYLAEPEDKQACLKEAFLQNREQLKYIHSLAAQLPFRAYISTSYDTFIEDEYERIKKTKLAEYDYTSIDKAIESHQRKEPFILKLQGDIKNSSPIVLSKRANITSYPNDLRTILSASSNLLVGFEKADPDLKDFKRLIIANEAVKCWLLVPRGHLSQKEIVQLQQDDKVTTIEYADLSELTDFFIRIDKLSSQPKAIKIYISYSSKDRAMKDQLISHLAIMSFPELDIEWLDGEIDAGGEKELEILKHLQKAQVILLLVSVDYLTPLKKTSKDKIAKSRSSIELEMTKAVERHTQGKARVIPVILRQCAWKDTPFFAELQVVPKDEAPINKRANRRDQRDQVYYDAALDIKNSIEKWARGY
jgi:hypothetical protein